MPSQKDPLKRLLILDECLRHREGFSITEMMEKCNRELDEETPITATNTIRADIENIERVFKMEVEVTHRGKGRYYNYKKPGASIFNYPYVLDKEDIPQIEETLLALSHFDGIPQSEWVEKYMEKLKKEVNKTLEIRKSPIVYIEDNPHLRGRNFFRPLYSAILNKKVLNIYYRTHRSPKTVIFVIHPYYLKQYNNRWFLFGYQKSEDRLTVVALDRILKLEMNEEEYIPNEKYDFNTYFDDIIGVTHVQDRKAEDVLLKVTKSRWPYIDTKPLHKSQEFIREEGDWVIFQIRVIPNIELERKIFEAADDMEVLEPSSLRKEIAEKLKRACERY